MEGEVRNRSFPTMLVTMVVTMASLPSQGSGGSCVVFRLLFTCCHSFSALYVSFSSILCHHRYHQRSINYHYQQPAGRSIHSLLSSLILSAVRAAPSIILYKTHAINTLLLAMHHLISLLHAIAGISAYPYHATKQRSFCGTGKPPQSLIDQARFFNQANDTGPPVNSTIVNLYFHFVVERGEQKPNNQSIRAQACTPLHQLIYANEIQIMRLQTSYAPSNIFFNYVNTSYTIDSDAANPSWDIWTGNVEPAFSETCPSLRVGGYEDLNLYFFSGLLPNTELYGVCPFPNTPDERHEYPDPGGCVLDLGTLPGYDRSKLEQLPRASPDHPYANHTLGLVAVHEIGHWFGLHHVFSDEGPLNRDCYTDNDFIDDTPLQLTMSTGCPVGKDSCPSSPGEDSIHNHMDYTDDTW